MFSFQLGFMSTYSYQKFRTVQAMAAPHLKQLYLHYNVRFFKINIRIGLSTMSVSKAGDVTKIYILGSHKGRHPMEPVYVNLYSKLESSLRLTKKDRCA